MKTIQPKAPFTQNLQTKPRQIFHREDSRRRWSLYESFGQIRSVLCRREKSNSGTRPNSAGLADEKGPLRNHDARLQTQQDNNIICSLNMINGKVIGDCMPRHRHQEFIRFLKKIDSETPVGLTCI